MAAPSLAGGARPRRRRARGPRRAAAPRRRGGGASSDGIALVSWSGRPRGSGRRTPRRTVAWRPPGARLPPDRRRFPHARAAARLDDVAAEALPRPRAEAREGRRGGRRLALRAGDEA